MVRFGLVKLMSDKNVILSGGKDMKKVLYTIIATVLFVPYILAYSIVHLFKMKNREDMPTAKEWFEQLYDM